MLYQLCNPNLYQRKPNVWINEISQNIIVSDGFTRVANRKNLNLVWLLTRLAWGSVRTHKPRNSNETHGYQQREQCQHQHQQGDNQQRVVQIRNGQYQDWNLIKPNMSSAIDVQVWGFDILSQPLS